MFFYRILLVGVLCATHSSAFATSTSRDFTEPEDSETDLIEVKKEELVFGTNTRNNSEFIACISLGDKKSLYGMQVDYPLGLYSDSDGECSEEDTLVYNHTKRKIKDSFFVNRVTDKKSLISMKNILQKDASVISFAIDKTQKNQVLCILLKDRKATRCAKYKKFVCTAGSITDFLEKSAHNLGYHIIHAEEGHAAGKLLQFLTLRKRYDVVAMGSNKPFCTFCNWTLASVLHEDYSYICAPKSLNPKEPERLVISSGLKNILEKNEVCRTGITFLQKIFPNSFLPSSLIQDTLEQNSLFTSSVLSLSRNNFDPHWNLNNNMTIQNEEKQDTFSNTTTVISEPV